MPAGFPNQPSAVTPSTGAPVEGLSEDERQELRRTCQDSLYFTARAIVGFREMVPYLHGDIAKFLEDRTSLRKVILVPRAHFKSSLCTVSYPIWRIINDPNIRICIMNATATNAEHFLRRIKSVFESNQLFQWLFPELIPSFDKNTKWSNTEIQVPRSQSFTEATIETLGVGGKAASRHYNILIKDDLVNEESAESDLGMSKVIEHHQYSEGLLDDPANSEDVIIGTRWSYADFYQFVLDNEKKYKTYIRSAIENDKPLFPDRFTLETLQDIEDKQGPYKFSCQYRNDPADASVAEFRLEWLRYYYMNEEGNLQVDGYDNPVELADLYIFAQVDPAITEGKRSYEISRSAIIIQGLDSKDNIFVLETWADRVGGQALLDKIFYMWAKWRPIRLGFESVAFQKILKPVIEDRAAREGKYINVQELKPANKHKDARIRYLQPYFFDNRVYIRKGMSDFKKEYMQFPKGASKDLLDAMAYGPDMWYAPDDVMETRNVEDGLLAEYQYESNPVTGY